MTIKMPRIWATHWKSIYKFKVTWWCVRVEFVRVEFGCLLPSIHSVRFGQLLRCAHQRIVNIIKLYSRTPVEPPPSPLTIPLIRPYFVWRTVYSVCAIPDQRPSLRRDQRPGQMGFSPSRTTTSPTVYFRKIAGGGSTSFRNHVLLQLVRNPCVHGLN